MSSKSQFDVIVVGAGLSGLASAFLLQSAGIDAVVVEARPRVGGRILSAMDDQRVVGDLGPSWVWSDFQPGLRDWLDRLNVQTFEQWQTGDAIVEQRSDRAAQHVKAVGQAGQMRIVGGTGAIVDALVKRLAPGSIRLATSVSHIRCSDSWADVKINDGSVSTLRASSVVVAVPPRILLRDIEIEPQLPEAVRAALTRLPTWMAAHAKFVAAYDDAFWRARSLSGRVASRVGPIGEAHDHCAADGRGAALTGFIGWPSSSRLGYERADLEALARQQLTRLFGDGAPEPTLVRVQDWASEALTTTEADLIDVPGHPLTPSSILRHPFGSGRIVLAGAEVSEHSPGLIAGALDAAETACGQLVASRLVGSN